MRGGTPRVADFSTHVSGPMACRRLAQLGADVVKIEAPPFGDGNRSLGASVRGEGIFHAYLNAGTRSIVADPRSEGWGSLVEAIARWADVLIVGNRPATARRLGLDFKRIRTYRSDIVYCQITGYGLDGPWADYPAHGLNMDALAGVVPIEWLGGLPSAPSSYRTVGNSLAGIEAALGIMFALYQTGRDGVARYVHTSIWETALSWAWRDLTTYEAVGTPMADYLNLGSRYRMYRTSDHGAILVCPLEQKFWQRFCDIVDLPAELRERGEWSTGVDTGESYPGEIEIIQGRLDTRSLDEWVSDLSAADVPVAPVLDWRAVCQSEHSQANGVWASFDYRGDIVRVPAAPVSVSAVSGADPADTAEMALRHRRKAEHVGPPPLLGEHTTEVLQDLGVSELATRIREAKSRDDLAGQV